MERICRWNSGLFSSPDEIKLSCSCPDWADMCKHVAAVLYGIGARFDQQPELLFLLRGVDEKDLLIKASQSIPLVKRQPAGAKILGGENLADIFGLDMAEPTSSEPAKKVLAKPKRGKASLGKRTDAKLDGKRASRKPGA